MPHWTPTPDWKGQDAVIIGGGPSLKDFDFSKLKGRNTIGCNDAFRLGSEVVKICLFGDASFFHRSKWDLERFTGRVATVAPALKNINLPWLHQLTRQREGLHADGSIGWNHSTGAAAVNLALALGAVRIFLLGFDMGKRTDGKTHWHTHNLKPIEEESYRRFIKGFGWIERDLAKFPEVKVCNVTDGTSRLPYFTRLGFASFLKYVPPQARAECIPCQQRKQQMEAMHA